MIEYNGMMVIEGWPEQVEESQRHRTVRFDGRTYYRVRYGQEENDRDSRRWPCPECAVLRGQFHGPGCDREEHARLTPPRWKRE